jgi:hypothetical protein
MCPKTFHLAVVYAQHMTLGMVPKMGKNMIAEKSRQLNRKSLNRETNLILPIPNLLQEVTHVDFLRLHFEHPWVVEHAPR